MWETKISVIARRWEALQPSVFTSTSLPDDKITELGVIYPYDYCEHSMSVRVYVCVWGINLLRTHSKHYVFALLLLSSL